MNYQEIYDAAIAYADRYDQEVADNISTFIILTEARVNRLLKTREQSARAYILTTDDSAYYALPPDYAGLRHISLNSSTPSDEDNIVSPIYFVNPEQLDAFQSYAGKAYYTILADQIKVFPCLSAGGSIELVYYQKVPGLNVSDNTNWLSDSHPDIYIAGMAGEISLFAKDYDIADGWFSRMTNAVNELENADIKERWGGDPLVMRTA